MDRRVVESDIPGGEVLIGGIGGVIAVLALAYLVLFFPGGSLAIPSRPAVAFHVLESLLMVAFGLGHIYIAYRISVRGYTNEQKWWVALWAVMGLAGVASTILLVQWHQILEGRGPTTLKTMVEELILGAAGGSLVGVFTGLTNADLRREQERTARQRDTFEFITDFLWHNVLNGLQAIIGYTTLLEDESDGADAQYLAEMRRRSHRIAHLVQNVRTLAEAESSAPDPRRLNLSQVLAEAVAETAERYPDTTIERDLPPDVYVRGDRFLSTIVGTMLSNAIGHQEGDAPSLVVQLATHDGVARLRIVDDGLAIPDGDVDAYLRRGGSEAERFASGLGRYLQQTVDHRYGGELTVSSSDSGRVALAMELPLTE